MSLLPSYVHLGFMQIGRSLEGEVGVIHLM
jgi:hypothetical protein